MNIWKTVAATLAICIGIGAGLLNESVGACYRVDCFPVYFYDDYRFPCEGTIVMVTSTQCCQQFTGFPGSLGIAYGSVTTTHMVWTYQLATYWNLNICDIDYIQCQPVGLTSSYFAPISGQCSLTGPGCTAS